MTVKNSYPPPLTQGLIEKLEGAKIFTKLDLKSGYSLCRIKEGDEWKTAFKTEYGLFEYLIMPFGLSNTPATFQALMNEIFRDLLDIYVIIYLDNILIFSKTENEHPKHVKEVLRRLQANNLYCNAKKCMFHVTEIDYLGLIVSDKGIQVNQSKVTAALDWAAPSNVKNVQEFLGFVNFYRRFVPDFANVTRPLYNLLCKDNPWQWGPSKQAAFKALKSALTSAPWLLQPDVRKTFFIECDVLDYAMGAILSQKDKEGKLHPVAFMSKSMSPAERNYDIFNKELLAIIRAFNGWRHLLEGSETPVQVLTDHKNLKYFAKSQTLNKRQIRWSNFLVDDNFQITYRPGTQNRKADILSRHYGVVPLGGRVENQVLLKPEIFISAITPDTEINDLIRKALQEDDRVKNILTLQQDGKPVKDWEFQEGLLMHQGKIFVPQDDAVRNLILESRHDTPAAGHLGQACTLELVARNFYWQSMKRFMNTYVGHCKNCLHSKPTNQLPTGLFRPPPISQNVLGKKLHMTSLLAYLSRKALTPFSQS
jgi:hypothetical protein